MEFKSKSTSTIKVMIDDTTYELRKPKISEIVGYRKELKEGQGNEDSINSTIDWLVGLGLPKEIILELDQDVFLELVEYVAEASSKKK